MKAKTLVVAVLAAILGTASVQAQDPPNFDFFGHAQVPATVGGALNTYTTLTNNGVVPTPIPMDFTGEEHTLVIQGTLSAINHIGPIVQHEYSSVTVKIYTDVGPLTQADFANQNTFEDATLILSGVVDGTLLRTKFPGTTGSLIGSVDWIGGTRLAELGTNVTGWPIGGALNTGLGNIPQDYDEAWDGKSDEPEAVAVNESTWGAIKNLFRE